MNNDVVEWPEAQLEHLGRCPVCGGTERHLLHKGMTDRVFGIADGAWDMYLCHRCASGYLDPRPDKESIEKAYLGYFTHAAEDHPIVRRKGGLRSFLHDLINGYENSVYGLDRAPCSPLGRVLLPFVPSLRSAADAECRHLPRAAQGKRLLDVGCGNGGFLSLAKRAGWDVEGVDFDADAVVAAQSRGLSVHHGGADVLGHRQNYYDVITICHVIEHVHDPAAVLATLHGMLKPGGILWLDTPNLDSLGFSKFGADWRDLDPPRHLHVFSRRALKACLRDAGFKSLKQRWRGMSSFEVYSASEAIAKTGDGGSSSYQGRPPLHAIGTELLEMLWPARREFLTFTARK